MAIATRRWQGWTVAPWGAPAESPGWRASFSPLSADPPAELPDRRLRLAEYLYYRGVVAWDMVVDAVRWQRAQRPLVGEIAVARGWLAAADVPLVLEHRCRARAFDVPFCAYAERLGLLTAPQRGAILAEQRRRQRRIGTYFVERGILSGRELQALAVELRLHNARCRRRAAERAAGAGGGALTRGARRR